MYSYTKSRITALVFLCTLILSIGIFVLPACDREDILSLEYEERVSVEFLDPCGYFGVNTSLGYGTEYKGITYRFAKTLTEEQRNRTVTETDACFEILKSKTELPEVSYTVYVTDGYYVPYTDINNLHFGYENIKTAEFATGIVQLVYGRDINYGVLYGLGASIAKERGYKNELTDLENALSLCESSPEHLDLNYACFLENYADGNIDKIKTLSIEFYKYLEANGKTDLLTDYSDAKRRNYFNDFLRSNGKSEYNATDLDGFSFYGGGNTIRLMWENENAKFELYDEYKDAFLNGNLGEDPLNCGYTDLRKHIVDFKAQMNYMRERLAVYNDAPKKVTAKFNQVNYYRSWYDLDGHTLNLNSVWAFMHEYTHSIINSKYGFKSGSASTIVHSLVYHFAHYPVNEQISYSVQREQYYINYLLENGPNAFIGFMDKLTDKLGHEINLYDIDDNTAYFDYLAKFGGEHENINSNPPYSHLPLGNYLVRQFGEERICEAAFNNTPKEILGKSWDTIIDEWRTYLDENCDLQLG